MGADYVARTYRVDWLCDWIVWRGSVGIEQSLLRMGVCVVSAIERRVDIFRFAHPCNRHGRHASRLHRDQFDGRLAVDDRDQIIIHKNRGYVCGQGI